MYKNNLENEAGRKAGSAVSICSILRQEPHATAMVRGSRGYPDISGRVKFYQMRSGVLVAAEVFGLPLMESMQSPMPGNMQQPMPGSVQPPMAGSVQSPNPGGVQPPMAGKMWRPLCPNAVFGFHIHSGSQCSGDEENPFANALEHYNPRNCMHPAHAGDMPPLFGNNGYAFQIFLTDRFSVNEIIGKTVIIHSEPDDFTSQPGGNAGERIACGQIMGRENRK